LPEEKSARARKKYSGEKITRQKNYKREKMEEETGAWRQIETRRRVLLSRYRNRKLEKRNRKSEKRKETREKKEKKRKQKKEEKRTGLKTGHYNGRDERNSCEIKLKRENWS
jgi:hypothetical protein